jgi:NADH:ubiquinone reductase (H+-translocating)
MRRQTQPRTRTIFGQACHKRAACFVKEVRGDEMEREDAQTVVIAGGGYSGVLAANRVRGRLRGEVRVLLVAPGEGLVDRIRLHEAAVRGRDVRRPYRHLLARGVEHVDGRVVGLDRRRNTLSIEPSGGASRRDQRYDALVLALGSRVSQTIEGGSPHAAALADPERAQRMAAALSKLDEGARVVVIGGGLTAVELSAEIGETYPLLRVELLTSELAPGLAGPARDALRAGLTELGVIIREGVRATRIEAHAVQLSDGTQLDAALCVVTAGFRPEPLGAEFGLPSDASGRVPVDADLRVAGSDNVFVVGDLAAPPAAAIGHGVATTRMACATAMPLGAHAGDQVARLLRGRPLEPFRFGYAVQCISLGRRSGLVAFVDSDDKPSGRVLKGRVAALVKESICRMVIGGLRLERSLAGAYLWPAPTRCVARADEQLQQP